MSIKNSEKLIKKINFLNILFIFCKKIDNINAKISDLKIKKIT